jgi:hypothetical protein
MRGTKELLAKIKGYQTWEPLLNFSHHDICFAIDCVEAQGHVSGMRLTLLEEWKREVDLKLQVLFDMKRLGELDAKLGKRKRRDSV